MKNRLFFSCILFTICVSASFFYSQHALYGLTTCHVTLSSDNNPGDIGDPGDLRYCLNSMNQNLNSGFDDYAITFAFPMTINLNGILPIINNSSNAVNITIGNPGSIATVTIDGQGTYSGFFIPMGNVTIQNINLQNMVAKGGDGGNGISGGGGGMGAGGAIYAPYSFLHGSVPSVTLMNVSISSCAAIGGNGGNYFALSATGNEGGAGGGGLSGNGGSVTTIGSTGGGGGGGFGGDGGDVTLSADDPQGGGGGGGGGIGSRASSGSGNLGHGGSDQNPGSNGNGYGLDITAGSGGGNRLGGDKAGGGGGGGSIDGMTPSGGGGGGSNGTDGLLPQGNIPPGFRALMSSLFFKETKKQDVSPSGGNGGDGAGGGGGGVVVYDPASNQIDGKAGHGGYGGGGGGGAGVGATDTGYTVQGGSGGLGGGGGGGGVNLSGMLSAVGGDSLGGGGGGGGGPSNVFTDAGGTDTGQLGGGAGGNGANMTGIGFGGGGGGGGSGLGGAIFVDSGLNFIVQALPGIPTIFNTSNNTVQAGIHGTGGSGGGSDGFDGSALGNSIFLRQQASLTFMAQSADDLLTLGDQVAFTDDTDFDGVGSHVFVNGNGTVIYNGITTYKSGITVNNTNFKVNGQINEASLSVCRNAEFSQQRGTLSGTGMITGSVFVNSGIISPDNGGVLTLGGLTLSSANSFGPGSLVHIDINALGSSLVTVTNHTSLAGTLEINLDPSATPGEYTILTASSLSGTFDAVTFTGKTPNYILSYVPVDSPTEVRFNFLGYPSSAVDIPATFNGSPLSDSNPPRSGRPVILSDLPGLGSGPTIYTIINQTGHVTCEIGQSQTKTQTQTYLKIYGKNGSCTIVGTKDGIVSNPLTVSLS